MSKSRKVKSGNAYEMTSLRSPRFNYVCISDFYLGSLQDLGGFDGILIECSNSLITRQLLISIRSCFSKNLFLKPVFLCHANGIIDEVVSALVDGDTTTRDDFTKFDPTTYEITQDIAEIKPIGRLTYERSMLAALLTFAYSRQWCSIVPVADRTSKMGFYYPILSTVDRRSSQGRCSLDILEQAEENGLISGQFAQSTYLCSECLNGFLQYREVCPGCQSSHLKTEELVHHFRCAYVAPISEFRQTHPTQPLQCPKCHHHLKHIGVDFDKPSSIHHCLNCQDDFQNYWVKARCLDCGHDQKVEHLVKKTFKEYEVTEQGKDWIEQGHYYSGSMAERVIEDTMSWNLFTQSLEFQMDEGKPHMNYMVTISFDNYSEVLGHLGKENEHKFLGEIVQMIKASQHSADIRNVSVPHIYFSLFTISRDEAEVIARRTIFLINHLLRDNLGFTRNVIRFTCESLTADYLERMGQNRVHTHHRLP